MYDLILIYPKIMKIEFKQINLPYPLFMMGSYLSKKYKIKILDERITPLPEILRFIEKNKVRFIGISTMIGFQLINAANISKKLKRLVRISKLYGVVSLYQLDLSK